MRIAAVMYLTLFVVLAAGPAGATLATRAEFEFGTEFWGCVDVGTSAASVSCFSTPLPPAGQIASGGGNASAGYGTLGAAAQVDTNGALVRYQALATATFQDSIRFDVQGRSPFTPIWVVFSMYFSAQLSVVGQDGFASVGGRLSLGSSIVVQASASATEDMAPLPGSFGRFDSSPIMLLVGQGYSLNGGLTAQAVAALGTRTTADASQTTRLVAINLFSDQAGTVPIDPLDVTIFSSNGASYPIPEPAVGSFLMLACAALGWRRCRRV